jgi:hypothetical protein
LLYCFVCLFFPVSTRGQATIIIIIQKSLGYVSPRETANAVLGDNKTAVPYTDFSSSNNEEIRYETLWWPNVVMKLGEPRRNDGVVQENRPQRQRLLSIVWNEIQSTCLNVRTLTKEKRFEGHNKQKHIKI